VAAASSPARAPSWSPSRKRRGRLRSAARRRRSLHQGAAGGLACATPGRFATRCRPPTPSSWPPRSRHLARNRGVNRPRAPAPGRQRPLGATSAGRDEAASATNQRESIGPPDHDRRGADLGLVAEPEAVSASCALLDHARGSRRTRVLLQLRYDTTRSSHEQLHFLRRSSWLTAGLMVVRTAFPELHDACTG